MYFNKNKKDCPFETASLLNIIYDSLADPLELVDQ
jgi:hypothetical protein